MGVKGAGEVQIENAYLDGGAVITDRRRRC